jgi:two-component system, response regulator PdtaR
MARDLHPVHPVFPLKLLICMTSALVNLNGPAGVHPLVSDLEAAGIRVVGVVHERSKLVQELLRQAPDVLVCDDALPDEALFKLLQVLSDTGPCPVLVFTSDSDAEKITRATEVGVHAYVVNGYSPQRLRPLIHLAQARFKREQALHGEMRDIAGRLEERKVVDRAKGILMRARQMSDDDAFQILRTASMHSNQRLGQVSQHIIHSARFAEDVNRSGQLRMLSQRLVKLALLRLAGVQEERVAQLLAESVQRIDANIAALGKSLSKPTFGDLLGQVTVTWARLKPALQQSRAAGEMAHLDELAELLLQEAERMTGILESAGAMPPLQMLNLAGRQRMLSQRFAKYALLQALGGTASQRSEAGMAESQAAFEKALQYLDGIPLTSKEIRESLDKAAAGWAQMCAGAAGVAKGKDMKRLEGLAAASEDLLDVFEQLSVQYERSMQMLVG